MTLEKAIKSNVNLLQDKSSNLIEREVESIQLGIEALKRIKEVRFDHRLIAWLKLPGETKE